jgi:hypothetical protein
MRVDLAIVTGYTVDPEAGERGEVLTYAHVGERTVALTLNAN